MSLTLRILLLFAGIMTAVWILYRIRKSKVKVEDAVYWICMAAILLLLGTFTPLSFGLSRLLGIQSPANSVFLLIIALLLEKVFTLSIKLSQLEEKVEILTAETAIRTKDLDERFSMLKEE